MYWSSVGKLFHSWFSIEFDCDFVPLGILIPLSAIHDLTARQACSQVTWNNVKRVTCEAGQSRYFTVIPDIIYVTLPLQ